MQDRNLKIRYVRQWVIAIGVCVALGVLTFWAQALIREADLNIAKQRQIQEVSREANTIRYRLEAETLSTFHLIQGLGSFISANPNLTQKDFQMVAEPIYRAHAGLVNIAAAPDMVIRYVYPLKGNEAAVGLDYTSHPKQRLAAMQVKESGQPVIAGPVNLVQGGTAFIGRFPVFTDDPETGGKRFWGIVSTPVDVHMLYERAGIRNPNLSIEIAIRGRDAQGSRGEVFFGDETIFQEEVRLPVHLFSGSWELGARPRTGWITDAPNSGVVLMAAWLVYGLCVVIVLLIHFYILDIERGRSRELVLSDARSQCLSKMSRELRSPLNAISGIAVELKSTKQTGESKRLTEMLIKSVDSLNGLLSCILNLSKLEMGKIQVVEEPIELDDFLKPILSVAGIEAERKGLRFGFSGVPSERSEILADKTILQQVIWSFLSNALKYTNKGSVRLDIEAINLGKADVPGVRISVLDTGIGISPERQKTIFEKDLHEVEGRPLDLEQVGIELFTVKQIADQLGGEVTVHSDSGKGSRFSVSIPVKLPES